MGSNFEFYDLKKVEKLMALEPAEEMVKRAQKETQNIIMMKVIVINFWVIQHHLMTINLSLHLKQNGKTILNFG